MAAIGRIYNQAFERSPAGTLAVTNGFLSGVADVVAQGAQIGVSDSHETTNIKLTSSLSLVCPNLDLQHYQSLVFPQLAYREAEKQPPPNPLMAPPARIQIPSYDPTRTLRFIAFGTFMGPILARWNHFLEHRFPLRPSAPAVAAAAQKLSSGTAQNVNKAVTASPARGNVSITALAKRVGMDQAFMAPLGVSPPSAEIAFITTDALSPSNSWQFSWAQWA
jgi:protein Mpv17